MDPDQDLLDQLDRQENGGALRATLVVAGFALMSALLAYFTLSLELHATRDISFDGAALVAVATAVLLGIMYRWHQGLQE